MLLGNFFEERLMLFQKIDHFPRNLQGPCTGKDEITGEVIKSYLDSKIVMVYDTSAGKFLTELEYLVQSGPSETFGGSERTETSRLQGSKLRENAPRESAELPNEGKRIPKFSSL